MAFVAFVAIGAGVGALHVVAPGRGGDHVAVTAMLSALIPVFALACFVSAVLTRESAGRMRARSVGDIGQCGFRHGWPRPAARQGRR